MLLYHHVEYLRQNRGSKPSIDLHLLVQIDEKLSDDISPTKTLFSVHQNEWCLP